MKVPTEIRDLVLSFIVDEENVVEIYTQFSGIKWYIIHEKTQHFNWRKVSMCQTLSESFIRSFQDQLDWGLVSEYQKLSERSMRNFKDRLIWILIPMHQDLSEDFIREFSHKVNWYSVSRYQNFQSPLFANLKIK